VSATIDFTGGRSEEKLENDLQTAISLLAHLPEHLKEFARRTTRDPTVVTTIAKSSFEQRVLMDLFNSEKHPGTKRDGGQTGLHPRLREPERFLRITLGGEPQRQFFQMQLDPLGGTPVIRKTGSENAAAVVSTAEIFDAQGNIIGDLQTFLERAVQLWETLLAEWDLSQSRA
jgi:hypothetical protein